MSEGNFVWYELFTSDAEAAKAFYAKVVGWTMTKAPVTHVDYTLINAGDRPVAGLMQVPQDGSMPPHWGGHIGVADVDATTAAVEAKGGRLVHGPEDIPDVGRFSVVADPQGAVFFLFRGNGGMPPRLGPQAPGQIGWHELHSSDWEAGFGFYAGLFGWEKGMDVDMGGMGTYQTYMAGDQGGGMFNDGQSPQPYWAFYFNVDDIDAAATRVTDAGGKILMGPHQVPGGSWILNAVDPQGALFSLVAPR